MLEVVIYPVTQAPPQRGVVSFLTGPQVVCYAETTNTRNIKAWGNWSGSWIWRRSNFPRKTLSVSKVWLRQGGIGSLISSQVSQPQSGWNCQATFSKSVHFSLGIVFRIFGPGVISIDVLYKCLRWIPKGTKEVLSFYIHAQRSQPRKGQVERDVLEWVLLNEYA